MSTKKNQPGESLTIRAVEPTDLAIVGLDVSPVSANDAVYDEERLNLLDDEDPEMRRLIDSIRRTGKIPGLISIARVPAIVAQEDGNATTEDTWCVVAGRRRVLAGRIVNAERFQVRAPPLMCQCAIVEGTPEALWSEVVGENEFRVEDTTLAKAHRCSRAMASGTLTVDEAANRFGVDVRTIDYWTTLVGLSPHVQDLVDSGELPAATVVQLKGLETEDQDRCADKLVKEGKTTAQHARAARKEAQGEEGIVAPPKRALADMMTMLSDPDAFGYKGPFVYKDGFILGALWAAGLLSSDNAESAASFDEGDIFELMSAVEAFQESKRQKRGASPEEKAAKEAAKAEEKAKKAADREEQKAAKALVKADEKAAKEAVKEAAKAAKLEAEEALKRAKAALKTAKAIVTKPGPAPTTNPQVKDA